MNIQCFGSSSKGNCYHISGNYPILLDVGLQFKKIQQLLDFKVSSIAGVLITHSHGDHSKAVNDFIKAGINCYMAKQTAAELNISGHRIKIVEPLKQFKIGIWTVLPFELEHDVFNLGYLLSNGTEKILYITDTYYCRYKFTGVTHLLIECNHSYAILDRNIELGHLPPVMKNRLVKSHFSLENVKEFLKANDLSKIHEIWLIHLSDGNSNEDLFKREIAELTGKMVFIGGETC
jgi:phosphoribosyl 1,2-cyclic phosphodiesterase